MSGPTKNDIEPSRLQIQANEAQFYASMSRGREAMHLFADSKVALREAVTRPSSGLSPFELMKRSGYCKVLANTCGAFGKDIRGGKT